MFHFDLCFHSHSSRPLSNDDKTDWRRGNSHPALGVKHHHLWYRYALRTCRIFALCRSVGPAAKSRKCMSKKAGFYYDGDTGSPMENIKTSDDCQNACEDDKSCYGWAYQSSSSRCWLQTSLSTEYTDATYTAGSCLGRSLVVTSIKSAILPLSFVLQDLLRKLFAKKYCPTCTTVATVVQP